jgi:hypothetical protein
MVRYSGLFFNKFYTGVIEDAQEIKLPFTNDELHCTFKYIPSDDELCDELVGKEYVITLVGYACDGKNSGFEVKLPDELQKYYINYDEENPEVLKVPHITVSLAKGARANDTKNLDFRPLDTPIKVKCRFGYHIRDYKGERVSFERQRKKSKR